MADALRVAGYAVICRDRALRSARRFARAARAEARHDVRGPVGAGWAVETVLLVLSAPSVVWVVTRPGAVFSSVAMPPVFAVPVHASND